jgi:hypothetical protein
MATEPMAWIRRRRVLPAVMLNGFLDQQRALATM